MEQERSRSGGRRTRNVILEGSIVRALLTLSVPIILGNLLQAGYQLTDAFWVGRLGAAAVAAVAVGAPVTFLVIALGSGLAMAGAVLVAQYAGAGRQDMVDHVAGQTMTMVLITSVLLGTLGYLLAPDLLTLLGVACDVRAGALGFMRVSFVGIVFVFSYTMFQALMRGIGRTRLPLLIVLGTVLLNFALDPLFIFGWGPLRGAGVVGAASATLITQGLAAAIGLAILLRGRHGIHLRWEQLRPNPGYIRRAFLLGLPGSIDLSTRALGFIAMSLLVAGFGTQSTAVYGVGSTIIQVVTIPAAGLSMALSTLVGQNLGAGQAARAEKIARLSIIYGFGALSAWGIVAFATAPVLVAFFVPSDPQVVAAGTGFLRIMALTWGFIGIQYCIAAVLRASGQMIPAMTIALVYQWIVQLPIAYALSTQTSLKIYGVWWSFPISNMIAAFLALAWFARSKWNNARPNTEMRQIVIATPAMLSSERPLGGLMCADEGSREIAVGISAPMAPTPRCRDDDT
ncbi:MATE family efflux transporter [Acidomonas methanolica]|uniref:MATE family efflux transporter n=1 Tax=Acidomonas methanolica TaxID=437 RepID=UPI002119D9E6|nr:MATE family efflux transporter [Acidomonas methanolica]MCQ9156190.1 MATE family efflux transporter [Acidomonas methanolica]